MIQQDRHAIRMAPGDLTPLRIDEALVRRMLVSFLRDETRKAGMQRVVLGVSGGIDSAVVAGLAAEALGPKNVLGLFTPYRTTAAQSRTDAQAVAAAFGIALEEVPITTQIDGYFAT
ncbi:MAG TPA: asparagine synthase-related protein, partial [Candidatus Limnocylindria bacterium]|nr:asparagine synthase-related protein [Candidatus Limnocylindria bacterium]